MDGSRHTSVVLKLTRASCAILGEAWMERKATGDGLRNGSLQLTTAEARDLQREKRDGAMAVADERK